jgi:hypothetical protein
MRVLLVLAIVAVGSGVMQSQTPTPPTADSTRGHSGLAGYVRDTLRHPLVLAGVTVEGENATTVSDTSGHFAISGLAAGVHTITIRKFGYQPISFEATLPADSTVLIDVHLRKVQNLGPVIVTAVNSPRLARTGYFERKKLGLATFLSPEQVDSMSFLDHPSSLLRTVRGIDVRCSRGLCYVLPRLAVCINLFVDGVEKRDVQLDELLSTSAIYAIEVYDHPATVPTEFQGRLPHVRPGIVQPVAGCAALIVWTRAKAAP